uniref:Uncharacterized protein n=1 Tax=Eubacterium plexicaudatum ASF492 TaxID=1235802 RepID=N1ZW10_9FIRM
MINFEYKIIKEFECCGNQMVTVRIGNAVHVMSLEEWHKVYGRNHQEKWETKVDWNRFVPKNQYKKKHVS